MEQQYCRVCGAETQKEYKVCPNCGARKAMITPKLHKCKHCNGDIASNAAKCPHCGKMSTFQATLISACTALLLISVFFAIIAFPKSSNVTKNSSENAAVQTETPTAIYQDNYLNIDFMKLANVIGTNATALQLKITNKSGSPIILSLEDVYVNNVKVSLVTTAVPLKIESGKISQSPFTLFTGETGLNADNITEIEFKVIGSDENFKRFYKSNTIKINL